MIRNAINKAILEQEISKRQVAIACEINYQNFLRFLGGHRPMPLKDIEKVLEYLKLAIVAV